MISSTTKSRFRLRPFKYCIRILLLSSKHRWLSFLMIRKLTTRRGQRRRPFLDGLLNTLHRETLWAHSNIDGWLILLVRYTHSTYKNITRYILYHYIHVQAGLKGRMGWGLVPSIMLFSSKEPSFVESGVLCPWKAKFWVGMCAESPIRVSYVCARMCVCVCVRHSTSYGERILDICTTWVRSCHYDSSHVVT